MEIEENRDPIDKKASEDHFMDFCQFGFGAPSIFTLFHSWTVKVSSEHFGGGLRKTKKARGRKEQARKRRIKQRQHDSL